MIANARTAASSPFLSWVGRPERTAWRVLAWFVLGLLLAVIAAAGEAALLGLISPRLLELISSAKTAAFAGPDRLYREAEFMALLALTLFVFSTAFLIAAEIVFRRPTWTFVSPARPFSLRYLALGFGVYGGLLAISLVISALTGAEFSLPILAPHYPLEQRLIYAAAAVPLLLLAAAAEEVLCRGLVLQISAGITTNKVILALVNGLVFSALHLDPDLAAFLSRALMGAVWAYAALELGGLEFGVGAHFANNLLLVLLVEPLSASVQPGRPYPLSDSLQDLATAVITLLVVRALGRRMHKHLTG